MPKMISSVPPLSALQVLSEPSLMSERDAKFLLSFGANNPVLKGELTDFQLEQFAEAAIDSEKLPESFTYGFGPDQVRPYRLVNGIAVVEINGVLVCRNSYWCRWFTGYESIDFRVKMAMDDPECKGVLLHIFSGGGMVAGCFELCEQLREYGEQKPIWSMVEPWCCSAAYAIACATQKIIVTPSSYAGSVGVLTSHVDFSKMLADWGVKFTFVFAGDHKVDGNPYEPLPDDVKKSYQADVDRIYKTFVAHVAKGRSMSEEKIIETQADVFHAEKLIELGMADEINVYEKVVGDFNSSFETTIDPVEEEESMSTETEQSEKEQADNENKVKTQAVQAERQRIAAITGSDAAKGREDLAQHLAMETDMEAEAAIKILEKSPKVKAEGEPRKGKGKEKSAFEQQMEQHSPNVQSDDDDQGESDDDDNPVTSMFKTFDSVKGAKKSA